MKITPLRTLVLAAVAVVGFAASAQSASAQISIHIGGGPPPPPRPEHRWNRPYPGAVWIAGHNEWRDGGWVWIGGYYDYPPRPGAYWVPARYRHGEYRPGHWAW